MNLTALPLETLEDRTIDRLFVEPLKSAHLLAGSPPPWVDLGSGGGSPAVPLKIAVPDAPLTMVESRGRKAAFLREVARDLAFSDTVVLNTRAEALLPASAATFGVITIRAVRVDGEMLSVTRRLLKPNGRLMVFTRGEFPKADGLKKLETVQLVAPDAWATVLAAD
jgi:16S rRNA (guanine527-N7)-methyltransferase